MVLTALYPPNVSHDKKAFEQHLRQLLGVSGELVAWQKIAVCTSHLRMHSHRLRYRNAFEAMKGGLTCVLRQPKPELSR